MALVANARMYSVNARVREDWKTLLSLALSKAGLSWDVIDHDPPATLAALWSRDDLGVAMMCGLPFSERNPRPVLVAAPLPSPVRYGGKPIYFTDIVVRSDSRCERLEDTFGGVLGYTLAESMSGGVALRDYLSDYRGRAEYRGIKLYRQAVGQLIHARGVIDALMSGKIDVGPLDSYYHDLLKRNEPAFASQVRVIASTAPRPIPPLVATGELKVGGLERLRAALVEVASDDAMKATGDRLLLSGFAFPDPADYDVLPAIAARRMPTLEEL